MTTSCPRSRWTPTAIKLLVFGQFLVFPPQFGGNGTGVQVERHHVETLLKGSDKVAVLPHVDLDQQFCDQHGRKHDLLALVRKIL
jgi:hypothetical protein